MKNTFLATLIAMLLALSFVSCDKDDEPGNVLQADTIVNATSFNIALNIDQTRYYLKPSGKMACFNLTPDANGVATLNADIAYKGGETVMDSMIVVKDYPLKTDIKKINNGNNVYSVNYYTITEDILHDIIAKMKTKGIEPKTFDEDIFIHTEFTFQVYNYANNSSYDIKLGDLFSTIILRNSNSNIKVDDGQQPKKTKLNCIIYYGDASTGTAYSLEVSGFDWTVSDEKSVKEGYNTIENYYFIFTDKLLENIKSFMAEKNVFPQETEFPKE